MVSMVQIFANSPKDKSLTKWKFLDNYDKVSKEEHNTVSSLPLIELQIFIDWKEDMLNVWANLFCPTDLVAVLAHQLEVVHLVALRRVVVILGRRVIRYRRVLEEPDVELLARVQETLHVLVLDLHLGE